MKKITIEGIDVLICNQQKDDKEHFEVPKDFEFELFGQTEEEIEKEIISMKPSNITKFPKKK